MNCMWIHLFQNKIQGCGLLMRNASVIEFSVLALVQLVMYLARETQQKLKESEQQCQDLTKASFGKCQPCLEDTCKAFYTSMCRCGFASF